MTIKALEQEPCRDMKDIREVMSCDADAETKCKMISNILTAKPHYFEKQEPKTEKDTITIPTNVLKFRGNGIVAYNVEWLKKHWKMEMHLVCGARMESEE